MAHPSTSEPVPRDPGPLDPGRPLRSVADLVAAGLVDPTRMGALEQVAARYAVAITPAMADLIDAADFDDAIGRQFVPDPAELAHSAGELADPIGDGVHSPVRGIVHRYPDRVLLKPVHVCPVYCRFCFRREVVGPDGDGTLTAAELEQALDYVRARPEIWEVVVTGGDPLSLSARRIDALVQSLAAIEHVRIVRFHTRVPVVDPGRITDALVRALRSDGATTWVVLHANHPRELSPAARAATARLVDGGIPLLSQSVLLRGINDDPAVLGALLRALVECRIKPYYLHHPDLAPGTAHFRLGITQGQALMRALRGQYSGLCQPTYVLDLPGGHGKSPIGPAYLDPATGLVLDYGGTAHVYPSEP